METIHWLTQLETQGSDIFLVRANPPPGIAPGGKIRVHTVRQQRTRLPVHYVLVQYIQDFSHLLASTQRTSGSRI